MMSRMAGRTAMVRISDGVALAIALSCLLAISPSAVSQARSSARTAVRVAPEEISPFLLPGADAGWSVEVQHAAVCRLTFSGPHKLRSGPFTIKAAQRYLMVSWKLPRKVAPGVWKGKLSCGAKAVRKRSRAVGTLAADFQVSGTGHGRGAQFVQAGSLRVRYSKTAPGLRPERGAQYLPGKGAAGFEPCQCTGYAYSRRPDIYNYAASKGYGGGNWNGGFWGERAAEAGELTGDLPEVGALVALKPGVYGASAATGHIAYVESVAADGKHFTILSKNGLLCNEVVYRNENWLALGRAHGMTFIYGPPGGPTPGGAPVFTADTPPSSAVAGVPYSYTFAASGTPAPTFSLGSGVLPPGLSLSAGGLLSGTPTTSGAYGFTVNATDSAGTTASPSITVVVGQSRTLAADVNGDGKADLVAVNDTSAWVMLSTGSSFSAPTDWHEGTFYGSRTTLACDVNGDGKADLVAVNDNSVWVMLSTGSGFSAPQLWSSGTFYGSRVTLCADVNGDGKADLVAVNDTSAWVMLSTGSSFSAPTDWHEGTFYGSRTTLACDVNGDGKADLVAVNDNSVWVMLSTGSGFSAPQLWSSGTFYGSRVTLCADVNGDGKADLVAVNDTSAWVMLSTGSSFSAPTDWHEGTFYGS